MRFLESPLEFVQLKSREGRPVTPVFLFVRARRDSLVEGLVDILVTIAARRVTAVFLYKSRSKTEQETEKKNVIKVKKEIHTFITLM